MCFFGETLWDTLAKGFLMRTLLFQHISAMMRDDEEELTSPSPVTATHWSRIVNIEYTLDYPNDPGDGWFRYPSHGLWPVNSVKNESWADRSEKSRAPPRGRS